MITESGRVMAVEQDCLWVETIQRSTCQSCSAEKGCGQGLVSRWGNSSSFLRVLLEGRDPQDYQLHQSVTIGIPEDVVATGSMLVYLTPLLGLLAGLFLANRFLLSEWAIIAAAFMGFVLGALVIRWHSYHNRNDRRVQPTLMDDLAPVQWQSESSLGHQSV